MKAKLLKFDLLLLFLLKNLERNKFEGNMRKKKKKKNQYIVYKTARERLFLKNPWKRTVAGPSQHFVQNGISKNIIAIPIIL